jgi:hypothetical protein
VGKQYQWWQEKERKSEEGDSGMRFGGGQPTYSG